MNRRSHRKSRLGCRECKRRHIKCDEKRPACAHCTITQRDCQYVSPSTSTSTSTSAATATAEPAVTSPGSTHHSDESLNAGFTPTTAADECPRARPKIVLRPHDTQWTNEPPTPRSVPVPGTAMNMNHMEFLLHYKLSIAIPELDDQVDTMATAIANKIGLEFPWLLHAMLAISARHLAVVKPEKSSLYLSEAFQLQTQAINLFNSEQFIINESNCSAALLFSSILGRHMLVDTLAGLESNGSVLLDNYCHCVQVHRGLRTIASDSWQVLPESEIWPLLLFAGIQRPRKAHGADLEDLRRWVKDSQELDQGTLRVCLDAIELLQVGLDEVSNAKSRVRAHQMAFIWSICTEAEFNDLVRKQLPQALVVLAHYTALLHHSKDLWQIGDSGSRFLQTICNILGASYADQLSWVKNLVFGSEHHGIHVS
ncbi:hypothetical protein F5Y03DRAFT_33623 [Xylaria venustula]|nr:hypothetical protein F5Y03DRAFT_33623 [Xylaria venustula]